MDWVFKSSSPWDLTELERDELDVLMMEKNQNMEAFSVESGILGSTTASPPLEPCSSKKPRGHVNEQHVSCLVDGCTADLSNCRDYHRRHRVCEAHSKTPVVAIAGKHQRFCQQCSRFHSIGEFDEVKRSCRKRLDGHNRRRRKPRGPETMYLNNYESFFTNHQGTKLLRFGGSPAYTCSSPLRWPNKEKSKSNQQLHVNVRAPPPSLSSSSSREKKFPFLLGTDSDALVGQPKAASDALSLLSNNTWDPNNFSIPNYVTGLNSSGYTDNNNNYNNLIRMIHFRNEGLISLENEAPQVLSFSWDE